MNQTITLEDLQKMSVVELKAFIYDQLAIIENLNVGIKAANELINKKNVNPPLPQNE